MKHRIEIKEPFQVIGRTMRMSEAEEFWHDIGGMWKEWNDNGMTKKMAKYSADEIGHDLDVSFVSPTEKDPASFTYTVGVRYNGAENANGYDIIAIPGGKYAVFDVPKEEADDIGNFMGKIIDFLPTAGYERVGVDIEYFKGDACEVWELIK